MRCLLSPVSVGEVSTIPLFQWVWCLLSPVSVGEVSGRGCASKEKLYYVQCENHEMDGLVEKFCYCSFNLCNTAALQVACTVIT